MIAIYFLIGEEQGGRARQNKQRGCRVVFAHTEYMTVLPGSKRAWQKGRKQGTSCVGVGVLGTEK